MKYSFFVLSMICIIANNIEAKIIRIPTDYPTIQEGVDSANSGDMVLVARGTYSGGIDMRSGVYLKSEEGPESTIIDGGASVIRCDSLTDTIVIDGFTICNASEYVSLGGGIRSRCSNLIVRNNIIKNNEIYPPAGGRVAGGGIYVKGGSVLIENNIIRDNLAGSVWKKNSKQIGVKDDGGGGIYAEAATITIKNNVITRNKAWDGSFWGGGISCIECIKAVIFNNLIDSNYAIYGLGNSEGNGIYCTSPVTIINNTFINNSLDTSFCWKGGGIYCERDSAGQDSIIIKNNIFAFDTVGKGGAIYCSDSLDLGKVFISYNDFYQNAVGDFYNPPTGVGNFSWGVNRNGNPCDSFYNINIDPGFTTGPLGTYYQQNVSGCGDYIVNDEFNFMGGNTTDGNSDTGWVDLGYHYGVLTNVEEKELSPTKVNKNLELKIIPNPFTETTNIKWAEGGERQQVNIQIYDLSGKLAKSFSVNPCLSQGQFVSWNGKNEAGNKVTAGIYFVRVETSSSVISKKVTFLRNKEVSKL